MKWSEFLNDHELNSEMYLQSPDGKLLFQKVIHDVLECVTGFSECIRIAKQLNDVLSDDTLNWFLKWDIHVNNWIVKVTSFATLFDELPNTSLEWPKLIAQIGELLTAVPDLRGEIDKLVLPASEKPASVLRIAISLVARLHIIWLDIQAKEYKRLWSIQRYGDLLK